MPSAREIAIQVLPFFAEEVLAGNVLPYGFYAKAIGRSAAKEAMVIGQAMHAMGAACVLTQIPVAPLHFAKRADDGWRGVFEADSAERLHVLPHYDLLYVTAREFAYSHQDFRRVARVLREVFPKYLKPDQLSPHDLWHVVIYWKLREGGTIFTKALDKCREIYANAKSLCQGRRRGQEKSRPSKS